MMKDAHLVVEIDVTSKVHRFPETNRIPREHRHRARQQLAVHRIPQSRQLRHWSIIGKSVRLGGSQRQSINRFGSLPRSVQHRSLMTDALDVDDDENSEVMSSDEPLYCVAVPVQELARRMVTNRCVIKRYRSRVLCVRRICASVSGYSSTISIDEMACLSEPPRNRQFLTFLF